MFIIRPSIKMAFHRRIKKELDDLHKKAPPGISLDESSIKEKIDWCVCMCDFLRCISSVLMVVIYLFCFVSLEQFSCTYGRG